MYIIYSNGYTNNNAIYKSKRLMNIFPNYFLSSEDFCHLLITFENSFDPCQTKRWA